MNAVRSDVSGVSELADDRLNDTNARPQRRYDHRLRDLMQARHRPPDSSRHDSPRRQILGDLSSLRWLSSVLDYSPESGEVSIWLSQPARSKCRPKNRSNEG